MKTKLLPTKSNEEAELQPLANIPACHGCERAGKLLCLTFSAFDTDGRQHCAACACRAPLPQQAGPRSPGSTSLTASFFNQSGHILVLTFIFTIRVLMKQNCINLFKDTLSLILSVPLALLGEPGRKTDNAQKNVLLPPKCRI